MAPVATFIKSNITFEVEKTIEPIYTGGGVALDQAGRILATCLDEDVVLTDLASGKRLAQLEGDGEALTSLSSIAPPQSLKQMLILSKVTPNASHLISCSRSLSMRIYALEISEDQPKRVNPVHERTLKPHTTPVITNAIDSSGTLLATGAADGAVKVWDIRGGFTTHTFRGHAGLISALHFFETIGHDQVNPSAPRIKGKRRPKSRLETTRLPGTEFSNEGATETRSIRLASGSEDGKIRIWGLEKRKAVTVLSSHVSVVRGLDFSTQGNILVSASRDKTIIVWDAKSWEVRKIIPVYEGLESVGFLEEGALIFSGGHVGVVRLWETRSGREITQEQEVRDEGNMIVHLIWHPGLRFMLCVHADHNLILHKIVPSPTLLAGGSIEPLTAFRRISGSYGEVIDLAYVTPERTLLALATNSENIQIVSVAPTDTTLPLHIEGNTYFGADVAVLSGHEDIVVCLDVDWSGCWLVTGAKDNTARMWRIDALSNSFECFAAFSGHAESVGSVALPCIRPQKDSKAGINPLESPPSLLLTGSQDRTIKRWDIPRTKSGGGEYKPPRALYTRKAHDKDINAIDINQDSSLFASASQDRTAKIWSIDEGEVQGVLRGHRRGVWSIKFAPRDTPAISGDTDRVASGGRGLVLTGSGDKTIKIWSLMDYGCLRTFEGHTNSVLKVLWLPSFPARSSEEDDTRGNFYDRRCPVQIVSAGGDGLVKIWDASSGEVACTLDNHTDRIWALAVQPETNTLTSGGGDSTVTFWKDTTSSTLAATAAASVARVEQEQQLENYIHRGDYRQAITLALALNHPARLLTLFTSVVETTPAEEDSLSGVKAVDEVLRTLADKQLLTLLQRLRDWNTNARTSRVTQRILGVLVKSYPAARFVNLKVGRDSEKNGGLRGLMEGLIAYTERHYKRIDELADESYLIDYTLREMNETRVANRGLEGNGDVKIV